MSSLGSTQLDLREIATVSYLMYVLREHYSLVTNKDSQEIRPYLLLIVKQFTTRVRLVWEEHHLGFRRHNIAHVPSYAICACRLYITLLFKLNYISYES